MSYQIMSFTIIKLIYYNIFFIHIQLQQNPRGSIIYLLHEKFIIRDKLNKKDRILIQDKLTRAFKSVTWFTYRNELELPIGSSTYHSDAGWGCMVRTGQMLLFQAMMRHVFEDNLKYEYIEKITEYREEYLNLLRLFQDNGEGQFSPYSIQNIAFQGLKIDRKPGDWYGPQAISIVLKRLTKIYKPVKQFTMYVCLEGNIYLNVIQEKSKDWTQSVFIVIPLRLGLNYIEPEYLSSVKKVFTFPQNVGIAGGRENSALYFIGISDSSNNLIYLDPHLVQKSVPTCNMQTNEQFYQYESSFHCTKFKKMPLNRMCTSVAIGFYIRDYNDFLDFQTRIKSLSSGENSIFTVYDQKPEFIDMGYSYNDQQIKLSSQIGKEDEEMVDDDGFCVV